MKTTGVPFRDVAALGAWLMAQGVDWTAWGTGNAKSLADLWRELEEGETVLQERPLLRVVNVVQVIVRRDDWVLLEAEQEFGDGQRRHRNQPPAEKIKPGEDYMAAAARCLQEELDVAPGQIQLFPETHRLTETYTHSPSYPGLPALYNLHVVEAAVSGLPARDFWRDNRSFAAGDPVKRHKWVWRRPAPTP